MSLIFSIRLAVFGFLIFIVLPSFANTLTLVGSLTTTDHPQGVTIVGNYAYMVGCCGSANDGLNIVDISNSKEPKLVGSFGRVNAKKVVVVGSYAYVVSVEGLSIIDISNPEKPSLVWNLSNSPYGYDDITVVGNYAYIVGSYTYTNNSINGSFRGLRVINISNSKKPYVAGDLTTATVGAKGVAVVGDIAYLTDAEGLKVIDVSNPREPHLINNLAIYGYANKVVVVGDCAYIVHRGKRYFYEGGLTIVNVSDPWNPYLVGNLNTGDAEDVVVAGDIAYVASSLAGLKTINISDPKNPYLVEKFDAAVGNATGVAVVEDMIYVADYSSVLFRSINENINKKAGLKIITNLSAIAKNSSSSDYIKNVTNTNDSTKKIVGDIKDDNGV